jgi:uncharacterized protein (DUF305 family)
VNIDRIRRIAAAIAVIALSVGGSEAAQAQGDMGGMAGMSGMSMSGHIVIPKGAIYTVADVEFMQGMIAHHAQAIFMSRLAAEHGANPRVLKLANKIDLSQVAEIRIMQEWLRRYEQFAPDTSSWHTVHMDGMLTDEQIKTLTASKGVDFDRNFLTMMIQHHNGALKMVKDLFNSPLSGQEVDVSVFANDVVAVQTAEIGVMLQLLSQLPKN